MFSWASHLTPTDNHIIAQHVFRRPALIASSKDRQLVIIPDIDILEKGSPVDWYMDMDVPENKLTLGMSRSKVQEHILFVRKPGAAYPPGAGATNAVEGKKDSSGNGWDHYPTIAFN